MVEKNEMLPQEEESQESSAYNEAGLQIQRLHELWLVAEAYALKKRFGEWNRTLEAVERELFSDILKMDDSKKVLNTLLILRKQYFENCKYIKLDSMKQYTKDSNFGPALGSLDMRHKYLKKIQEDSGKGSIYRDKDDQEFE